MNDLEQIVRAAQEGDTKAFTTLVSRFERFALDKAHAWVNDRHRAEEIVQEAFLEAALKLHQLDTPVAFASWFKRIVVKQCDRVTRLKTHATVELTAAAGAQDLAPLAPARMASDSRNSLVALALTTLSPDQRDLIHAVYWENEPQKDLAERLGLPLTTVKKRLYTARQKMAEFLGQTAANERDDAPDESEAFPRDIQVFMAAWHGHANRVETLLAALPELAEATNDEGLSLLLFAAHAAHYSGNDRVVQLLLSRGVRPGRFERAALGIPSSILDGTIDFAGPWRRTALHWAVCGGHLALAKNLILRGANPNLPDQWGCTAVHLAADFGHGHVLTFLLGAGGDPRRVMNNGKGLIHLAAGHGNRGLIGIARNAGLSLDLFAAASLGDLDLAQRLIRRDADSVNQRLKIGASPLNIAAERGHEELAEYLISRGAKLDPISAIALGRNEALLEMLAQQPGTIDKHAGSFGFTPLHAASVRGQDGLVRLLLHQGAEVNRCDRMFRKTPLHEALFFGRESAARLLYDHGGRMGVGRGN
jgi:RNA polymerase sigma factor (sigma-70 family)